MEKYQLDMWKKLEAYNRADTEFTIWYASGGVGKSMFNVWLDEYAPKFVVLEDHWEIPNHKRVDVNPKIAQWIEEQDISQWKWESNGPSDDRYVITPELLTMLQLKFS